MNDDDKKRVLKAKPLACRLILASKNGDEAGADHTLGDVAKVMKADIKTYVILCSVLAKYAALALDALDEHFGNEWGAQLLDFWTTVAIDAEAGSDE